MGDEITGRVVGSVESMGGIEDDELCELIDNIMLEEKISGLQCEGEAGTEAGYF